MRFLSAAILVVTLVAGARAADQKKKDDPSQIGNRDIGKCLNFYSLDKEMALGKQLAEEVSRQSKLNDDPMLSEYVNRIGQNLARNSDAKVPFIFRVIDGDEVNAFALPGGYVFVYTGLIKIASEEDEFAGALAHEIAHVAARHMTCRATQSQIAGIASAIAGSVLGGWTGYAVRQASGAAIPMTFLSFTRHDESEADYLGVQYLYAAGYDPTGAISIFEKLESLQKTKPGVVAKVFATHPMDDVRIEKTEKQIQQSLPAKPEYVVTTSEYRAMRDRLLATDSRKPDDKDDRPRLRVRTGDAKPEDSSQTDGRPTIKRKDLLD
jgi:predicted Zn-dependent protease